MGTVTAGELFEEYLSREARERILADGGGAVELDADSRRAIVDAVMTSGGGCGGDGLPSATFDVALRCALEQLARGRWRIFASASSAAALSAAAAAATAAAAAAAAAAGDADDDA